MIGSTVCTVLYSVDSVFGQMRPGGAIGGGRC